MTLGKILEFEMLQMKNCTFTSLSHTYLPRLPTQLDYFLLLSVRLGENIDSAPWRLSFGLLR